MSRKEEGSSMVEILDEAVLRASNQGVPVTHDISSDAGQAYSDTVSRLLGEDMPLRFHEMQRKGLLSRMFGGGRR